MLVCIASQCHLNEKKELSSKGTPYFVLADNFLRDEVSLHRRFKIDFRFKFAGSSVLNNQLKFLTLISNLHQRTFPSNPLSFSNISSIGFSERKKCRSIQNNRSFVHRIMCSSKEPPAETGLTSKAFESLKIGSTTIIVEAPKMLKTTTSLPCLRVNSVLVKADDVGRD
ncbi:unnamed protein product [Lactuca saligna]|uniref:Uncharacterized protein n=1 Tax=Lactuca saligna TaxID=75948 RepID=A0AA36EBM2_LACSI|nr:unnamed protein product [Lactuca saligna]